MISVDAKEEIRRAYYLKEKSIRQIHRETGHHRVTIRKALADGLVGKYELKGSRACPVLDRVKPVIATWLAEDAKRPRKERHTAKRIWDRLCTEHGFAGGVSTVRRYVGQRRRELGQKQEVFIPLSYAPGQVGQVDFGEVKFMLCGEPVRAHLFCLRLGYSKQPFVMGLPCQAQECFLEGHVRAFEFLEGVPHILVYDTLKVAVKKILQGRSREAQATFIAFRSHSLFESRFCTPGQAHEKGLVEGLVGYVRRNWFVPPPEVSSWEELNGYLWQQCQTEGERRLRGMSLRIGEGFCLEQAELLSLPERSFACCSLHPVEANGFGLVSFQTNRYSVPAAHAHQHLWLRVFFDHVEITNGRKTLAAHPRCYGREEDILDPLHYLPVLERRPGAWDQAAPIRAWRQRWPEVYARYLEALKRRFSSSEATRVFVRILRLHEEHSESVISEALEEALRCHCYEAASVKQLVLRILEQRTKSKTHSPIRELEDTPSLPVSVQQVAWPEVHTYNALLSTSAPEREGGAAL